MQNLACSLAFLFYTGVRLSDAPSAAEQMLRAGPAVNSLTDTLWTLRSLGRARNGGGGDRCSGQVAAGRIDDQVRSRVRSDWPKNFPHSRCRCRRRASSKARASSSAAYRSSIRGCRSSGGRWCGSSSSPWHAAQAWPP